MIDLKVIAALGAALLLSIGGNLWLGHKVLTGKLECAHAAEVARLEGQAQALQGRTDLLGTQIGLVAADRASLVAALDDVQAREDAALARLRRLIGELPTPTCAPGAGRVEAWNSIGRGDP